MYFYPWLCCWCGNLQNNHKGLNPQNGNSPLLFQLKKFHRTAIIEIKNFVGLRNIIEADYPTYSGKILELYFKQKFAESYQFRAIGSWWETKGNQNEIDIVALGLEKNKAVVAEVKRQRKNFKPELLEQKVEHLKKKLLPRYTIETMCLSLEDM